MKRAFSLLVCAVFVSARIADADPRSGALGDDLNELGDAEVNRRYEFIRGRLEDGKRASQSWQVGFSSVWGVGVGVGIARAASAGDEIERAAGIVTSVKAAGGLARLILSPNPGHRGAMGLQALPATSPDQRRRRLAAAEALLNEVESRALDRLDWKRHAYNVAVNSAGGGVILGVGGVDRAWDDALVSFGLGVVAGEVMLFTMPWRGEKDAADYRKRFLSGPADSGFSWRIVPAMNGFSVHLEF